jgi:MFS family permease
MIKEMNRTRTRSLRALDALSVFLADVRDGVGPYLAIYLLTVHHWDAASIGIAMSAMGMAAVVAQTPAGWLIDRLFQKRLLLGLAALAVAAGCVLMVLTPIWGVVLSAQVLVGSAASVFAPALAAISLGLVGHRRLARRLGRNEAFNHAGNVGAAVLAGLIGHFIDLAGIFYLVAAMSVASMVSVMTIRERDIDHALARGAASERGEPAHISDVRELLADRRIAWFAGSVVLFHFANAAMLPLVGQVLSIHNPAIAPLSMSACIIVAQCVMIPMAVWAGRLADSWGRKAIFLIGFAVLPIRGVLYTVSDDPYFLVSVQILDGIGAGIFGVLSVVVVADLTHRTGRFNLTQGAISAAVGIGASLSNAMTGVIVEHAGYDAAFVTLATVAGIALMFFWRVMPETNRASSLATQPVPLPMHAGSEYSRVQTDGVAIREIPAIHIRLP